MAAVSDNIWIGDLPPDFNDDLLRSVFEGYGAIVSCRTIPPKQPGQKAAALVRFQAVQDAQWVVENLNGNMPEGFAEPIVVQFSRSGTGGGKDKGKGGPPPQHAPQPYQFAATGAGKGGGGAPPTVGDNIWIGDLPPDFTDDMLKQVFEGYGTIVSCKVIPPKNAGQKAAALMRFQNVEDAQWVVENLNGNMPEGFAEPIVVQYAKNSGGGKGGGGGGSYGKAPTGKGPTYLSEPYGTAYSGPGGGKGGGGNGDFRSFYQNLVKGGVIPGVGGRPDEQCVYVKGLPPDTNDQNLYELFSPFGAIAPKGVRAMLKPDGTCTSIGFVDFQDANVAAAAVAALNGQTQPDGTYLQLNLKRQRKGGGKGKEKGWGQEQ